MGTLARDLLGLKECSFTPTHARNLANEFKCYVNYESPFASDSQPTVSREIPFLRVDNQSTF